MAPTHPMGVCDFAMRCYIFCDAVKLNRAQYTFYFANGHAAPRKSEHSFCDSEGARSLMTHPECQAALPVRHVSHLTAAGTFRPFSINWGHWGYMAHIRRELKGVGGGVAHKQGYISERTPSSDAAV